MNIRIVYRFDREQREWCYRVICQGPSGEGRYADGETPYDALRTLAEGKMASTMIYAATLLEQQRKGHRDIIEFRDADMAKLRKKNAALRRELKELKK